MWSYLKISFCEDIYDNLLWNNSTWKAYDDHAKNKAKETAKRHKD